MEETEEVVVEERRWEVDEERRSLGIFILLIIIVLLVLCLALSTCVGSCSTPPVSKRGVSTQCPQADTVIEIDVPSRLSSSEAVLVGARQSGKGRPLEVFLYDDPCDTELNLLVESADLATSVCWQTATGWQTAYPNEDIPERGSQNHNVEFLIPKGEMVGATKLAITTEP